MRKLMWFTVGFSAACSVGVYLVSGIWLLILTVTCVVALGGLLVLTSPVSRKIACVVFGCTFGFVWLWCFDLHYLNPVREMDGKAVILDLEVTEYSEPTEFGLTAEGKGILAGRTYSIQFYLNQDITLAPGDRVEGCFRLRFTGGGIENPTYHRGKGIFLLAYPETDNTITFQSEPPLRYFPSVLRMRILTLLNRLFPEDTRAFACALLLGDTNGLSYETVSVLKTSGIYHVVAVSGMHVSILFALVYFLCGKRRGYTALIGLPLLFLFAAVAGFTPSIVRACIMQALMIVALLFDKEYDPPTALSAAILVLLLLNPIGITSVGLQLSAGCMVGIFLFSQRMYNYILKGTRLNPPKGKSIQSRLKRWAVGSVSVTLGALSATAPLCAIYFGSISLAGVLTNLLTMWMITIIFCGMVAACVLGALWSPLGCLIGWVLSWPIRLILWVTEMIAKVPVSALYTSSVYIVAWLVFSYILITVFLKTKKKHPFVLAGCITVGLIGALACSWVEPRLDDYRITAVDVGQGQCLILQTDGKYYMVDCGGDTGDEAANKATQLLFSQGVFHLDGLILTHYDTDHAGGAEQLLSRMGADTIYLPIQEGENEIRDAISEQYADAIHWVREDTVMDIPGGKITIFPSFVTDDPNDSSLCILFQQENCDILITGDRSEVGERYLLDTATLPDLEILVAGHHGSRTSSSWDLLSATRPEIVIISVGEDNRYGHPSWESLERFALFGCDVYRTDTQGTIIFRG